MSNIDLVIPMVFPQDPAWQAAYAKAMGGGGAERNVRYRSWNTEELLVKCCLKFMPWLRCIHILLASESQADPLLSSPVMGRENWKIVNGRYEYSLPNGRVRVGLVFHDQFMPVEALPCFSSPCIEMFLHRIPDLSEYFIYANDDMFPLSPLAPEDFFRRPTPDPSRNGGESVGGSDTSEARLSPFTGERGGGLLPCQDVGEKPYPTSPNIFHKACQGGLNMVAAPFGKHYTKTFLRNGHSFAPFLKSACEEVWRRHGCEIMEHLCPTKRRADSYNQYLYVYYQHLAGLYVHYAPRRQYVGGSKTEERLAQIIQDPNAGIVCLNDNGSIKDWEKRAAIVRREIARKIEEPLPSIRGNTSPEMNRSYNKMFPKSLPNELPIEGAWGSLDVLVVHYNTPELTKAAIQSLWKNTPNARVTIFDNSDQRPFDSINNTQLTIIDNTRGQIVDFDKFLAQFPDKEIGDMTGSRFGSSKHCYSVELCLNRFPNGFFLMDSDVLIKQDITSLADNNYAWVGQADIKKTRYGIRLPRVIPFLCWINTPMLRKHGIHYFNRQKMYALSMRKPDMAYDTGCWFHEAVEKAQLPTRQVNIREYMVHFGHGSWKTKDGMAWLNEHKELWRPTPNPSIYGGEKYTVLTYIFGDYEMVHEVGQKDPNAHYILVTDRTDITSNTWSVVHYRPEGKNALERMYDVRFNPFQFCKTELVIRLDASIGINRSLLPIIEQMQQGGYDRCLMIHPRRNTMTAEYAAWVKGRGYSQAQADRCLDYMRQQGYPMDYKGIFQSCFEVVRNNSLNSQINGQVLSTLKQLAPDGHIERINQTVLSFVINHYYANRLNVLPVPERIITDGKLMTWYMHNSLRTNNSRERIEPYMFNRRIHFDLPFQ